MSAVPSLLNQLAYLVRKISSVDMYVHSLRHVMCVFTNKCRPKSTSDVYVFLGPLHGDANTDDLSPLVTYVFLGPLHGDANTDKT